VSEVFPSIPPSVILDDLRVTNSVEMTIDNIVEGRLTVTPVSLCLIHSIFCYAVRIRLKLAATLRWFTAGGAIRIAVRQLSQTWKLRHYDVIDDIITRKV